LGHGILDGPERCHAMAAVVVGRVLQVAFSRSQSIDRSINPRVRLSAASVRLGRALDPYTGKVALLLRVARQCLLQLSQSGIGCFERLHAMAAIVVRGILQIGLGPRKRIHCTPNQRMRLPAGV
jgi:hypothetical protein